MYLINFYVDECRKLNKNSEHNVLNYILLYSYILMKILKCVTTYQNCIIYVMIYNGSKKTRIFY